MKEVPVYQVMDTETFTRYMVSKDKEACEKLVKRLNNEGRRCRVSRLPKEAQ